MLHVENAIQMTSTLLRAFPANPTDDMRSVWSDRCLDLKCDGVKVLITSGQQLPHIPRTLA